MAINDTVADASSLLSCRHPVGRSPWTARDAAVPLLEGAESVGQVVINSNYGFG